MDKEPATVLGSTGAPSPGDLETVLDVLFRTHCASLVRLAVLLLGDRGDAEEVVQDAFVSLQRNWPRLPDPAAAGSYPRSAVVRGCRSQQRHLIRARSAAPKLAVVVDPPIPEDRAVVPDAAGAFSVSTDGQGADLTLTTTVVADPCRWFDGHTTLVWTRVL